jgi:ADP-heptose:LPS heptosyltransferase
LNTGSHKHREGQPPFDAALLLPNSIRSALEVWLAKIPRRIGRTEKKGVLRKWLINQPFPKVAADLPTHQADEYRAVVYWLGASPFFQKNGEEFTA